MTASELWKIIERVDGTNIFLVELFRSVHDGRSRITDVRCIMVHTVPDVNAAENWRIWDIPCRKGKDDKADQLKMNKLLHYAGPEAIKEYTATLSSLVAKTKIARRLSCTSSRIVSGCLNVIYRATGVMIVSREEFFQMNCEANYWRCQIWLGKLLTIIAVHPEVQV